MTTPTLLSLLSGWWRRGFFRAPPPVVVVHDDPAPAPPARAESLTPASAPPVSPAAAGATVAVRTLPRRAAAVPIDPGVRARTFAALENLQQLPALQSLAQGFLAVTARGDGSVDEVVEAVEKDPALCVRVLRLANSVEVRPEQRIEDVFTAVQMLGLQRVATLRHALFTLRDAQVLVAGLDWRHLWLHSLATAALAEELERQLNLEPSPQLYLAALMHDVGKIVLSTVVPDGYRAVLAQVWNEGGRLEDLELKLLGVSHREAGRVFAAQAGLSAEVLATIAHHDHPTAASECRRTVALVQVANYLAKLHGLGFGGARLEEADGEIDDLVAWDILAEELGWRPAWSALEEPLRVEAQSLKVEFQSLHGSA